MKFVKGKKIVFAMMGLPARGKVINFFPDNLNFSIRHIYQIKLYAT